LCAHVAVTPDDRRIAVLSKGNPHGLIGWIPKGGQTQPIQILGEMLR